MFITCAHVTGVTLFHSDGGVRVFRSMADALKQLGYAWICQHVGKNFCEFSHTESFFPARRCNYVYIAHDYVMRDDFGLPLVPADFSALRRRRWQPRKSILSIWSGEGPVPGIHKRSAGGHYFRHISHANARRGATTFKEEGEVAPRAARNAHGLPNSWDDYHVAALRNRNWKRFRKTRWKG